MSENPSIINQRVNRLKVFSAVKSWMLGFGECPHATDIAAEVGLTPQCILIHMRALNGASGLPLPIEFRRAFTGKGSFKERNLGMFGMPVPVDMAEMLWTGVPE